ncbi:MAG: hypothetical protein ABSF09_07870 [Candidatus Bathyarchaeia archaeon]
MKSSQSTLIAVSVYWRRRHHLTNSLVGMLDNAKNFVFGWVLAGLLGLYSLTKARSTSLMFVTGNIIVEII